MACSFHSPFTRYTFAITIPVKAMPPWSVYRASSELVVLSTRRQKALETCSNVCPRYEVTVKITVVT